MPEEIARALDTAPPSFARIERAGRAILVAIVGVGVLVSVPGGPAPLYAPAKLGLIALGALSTWGSSWSSGTGPGVMGGPAARRQSSRTLRSAPASAASR
ncbi:MAG: hypothetical protein ACLF0P_03385 [Thermoanaerobaculia bacterium]